MSITGHQTSLGRDVDYHFKYIVENENDPRQTLYSFFLKNLRIDHNEDSCQTDKCISITCK